MPRSRPTALHAGISAYTARLVLAVERQGDYYMFVGATDQALRRYRAFLSPPGRRPLYPEPAECSCRDCSFDDVRHARDVLESVLTQLPPPARRELGRLIAPLDAAYRRRTLPDPFARAGPWWHRRLTP
jgi:hypothetical protein